MKKLFIILISILTIFILSSCDVLELSAPEVETMAEETSTDSEATTVEEKDTEDNTTEDETYYGGSHKSCEYCGQLEGESRWFIARVTDNLMIDPMGSECFEAKSAMGAGIALHYSEVDGDPDAKLKAGHIIKVEYNGMIMESYPVQIGADKVSVIYDLSNTTNEELKKYLVNYGNLVVKSGENKVYPLEGYVYSEGYTYNEITGENIYFNGDGDGIHIYLEAIFDGKISDENMPVLYLDGELDVDLSSNNTLTVKYIDLSTKKETSCKLRHLSELDIGEYYVILDIVTKNGNSSYGYEYIFKLVIDQEIKDSAKIKDYIIYENGNCRLILPLSRTKLSTSSCGEYLYLIDVELLTHADDIFTSGHKERAYGVYLGFDDENYLCLCNETICDSDDEIGHSHSIEKIRITKEPCK